MSPFPEAGHDVCYYCKLQHKSVEAGGVHHCPNPLCQGPGAATFRRKLSSYAEVEGTSKHTVDNAEMLAFGEKYAAECKDAALAAHILASVARWRPTAPPTDQPAVAGSLPSSIETP
jgi:hypothetical protein